MANPLPPLSDENYGTEFSRILRLLRERNASDLALQVETLVRAGATREEEPEDKRRAAITVRVPLSFRARLIEELRVLLSASSVPLMLRDATAELSPGATSIRWEHDYLDEGETSHSDLAVVVLATSKSLEPLEAATVKVASILSEMLRGGEITE